MFFEWLTHTAFVLILLVGSIVALIYAFMRRSRRRVK
ncbi:EYxxD motif small membrane protein [Bacillus sp. JJ1764]